MFKKVLLSPVLFGLACILMLGGSSIVDAQNLTYAENETIQAQYRDEIGAYRDSERTFEVAREQYAKLGTLASLEQAVSGTRNVLLARSKVLITYLEILKNDLELQHGVNLAQKDEVLERLETQLAYLKKHQDAVLLANDRDAILAVVTDFELNAVAVEDAVYRARTLTAIGKVQTVNDKVRALLADIQKEHAKEETTSLIASRRERAYAETTKHIDDTEAALIKIIDEDYSRGGKLFNKSRFTQFSDQLSVPYVNAQKSLGFLEELLSL